ncbi:MAG: tRNA lysidine(34) synthetase TilS [Nitrospinaceae bacterium]|nr:tRNA lysidine(34) synthetase TilS [Nitrospinaceae bacterium]
MSERLLDGPAPERQSFEIIRNFEAKVRKGCIHCGMESVKGPLLVGFSGGADSTALLLSLYSIMADSGKWPDSLTAVHIEHGIRPGASECDARQAKKLCLSRGIPFVHISVNVDENGAHGLEDAARRARRGAFLEAAKDKGARAIALAHTQDDQAETVLMRLFEGAGPKGISGILPRAPLVLEPRASNEQSGKGVVILRPLLDITRAEVEAYLETQGVLWVEDDSNADESRLRNLIRRKIVPIIRDNMGEGVVGRISGSASHVRETTEALAAAVKDAKEVFFSEKGGTLCISPLTGLILLPTAVRADLWADALERVFPVRNRRWALKKIIESLEHLALTAGPSASIDLADGMKAWRRYDDIYIGLNMLQEPPSVDVVSFAMSGLTRHLGLGCEIEAIIYEEDSLPSGGPLMAFLDPDLLSGEVVLRNRRPGDRFHPLGSSGEKKLKDFFIDRKVPRPERDDVPVLAAGNEIIWVVGHLVSEKYRAIISGEKSRIGEKLMLKARISPKPTEK